MICIMLNSSRCLAVAIVIVGLVGGGALIWVGSEQSTKEPPQVTQDTNQAENKKPAKEPDISPPGVAEPVAPRSSGETLETAPTIKSWKPGDPFQVRPDLKASEPPK